jgi:deoxyhypusine synthase
MNEAEGNEAALAAVLVTSEELPEGSIAIRGYDFNEGRELDGLLGSFKSTGLQATALGRAIDEVNAMLDWRVDPNEVDVEGAGAAEREAGTSVSGPIKDRSDRCKIFLGYTSNLVSSGVREHIRYLVQHKMVDVVVTTAGGVEEDVIKCLAETYVGDFSMKGADLRRRGINRAGNVLIPNSNYCKFEDWVMPILEEMLREQDAGAKWTPSKVIERLGREIDDERSICYWAAKNGIPIYCPALTDGSLGDMLYFHTYKSDGLVIDIVQDIRSMNDQALKSKPRKTGVIILGGGVPKHHICNANLMKNGADFAVYLNTAQEYDGSDSGARPDEAVSWGKIRADATPVKVHGDASILFPLLVSQTFAKRP